MSRSGTVIGRIFSHFHKFRTRIKVTSKSGLVNHKGQLARREGVGMAGFMGDQRPRQGGLTQKGNRHFGTREVVLTGPGGVQWASSLRQTPLCRVLCVAYTGPDNVVWEISWTKR